ncbi:MAG: hypothetical protein M3Y59_10230 [Myxococcota bacterium]|nr:hypothetical protein [Myxococcota bacterium]
MKSRLILLLSVLLAIPAGAVPTVEGAPRWASDLPGCALSAEQSRYAVQALVTGAAADRFAALTLHDARTGARPDAPLGTFSLSATDVGGARLEGARAISFSPQGWTEERVDGTLTARAEVFTLAPNVFAVTVTLGGVSSPLSLRATLEGNLGTGSATLGTGSGAFPLLLTLDSGEERPFGVALGSTAGSSVSAGAGGSAYAVTLDLVATSDGVVAFVLAQDDATAQTISRGEAAVTAAGGVEGWAGAAQSRWAAQLATFSPPHTTDAEARANDALALSVLLNNELGGAEGGLRGSLPAKTHFNYFEVRDTGFLALAAVEGPSARAQAYLDGVWRGQEAGAGNLQAGLIPHRVDEAGGAPSWNQASVSDHYSERPAFAPALRALRDRGLPPLEPPALTALLDAQLSLLGWWRDHRDWDEDLVLEANGGLEAGADNSPRFFEMWGSGDGVRLPVPEVQPRARTPLNAVDVSSSLYAEYLEASQLAGALGRGEDQRQSLARASLLGAQIDEATFGFWDEVRGGYFDYWLQGTERERVPLRIRTPVIWAPLTVGAARELTRANRALAHLLSEVEFWRPHGVPSVAVGEGTFDSAQRWRGAAFAEQQYEAMVALYRYGYEAEAEQLRQRTLATLQAAGTFREAFDPETGAGRGPGCFGTSAAVAVAIARNRHQEEAFAVERGGLPRVRQGQLRRMIRISNGQLLLEVRVAGSREVPVTTLSAADQLFAEVPMGIELSDPHGLIGDAEVEMRLPAYEKLQARWTAGPGAGRTLDLEGEELTLTARVGDRIELSGLRFVGAQTCGCAGGGGAGLGALGVLLWLLAVHRRRA